MGWIYKVTNQINGKVYIGKTEEPDPMIRWNEHKREYKRERCEKRPFYDAMKKYGVENFVFEVIDQEDDSEKLSELEIYYIDKYHSYINCKDSNGYNATLGGDGKSYLNLDEQDVINYHVQHGYVSGITAEHFGVDRHSIKKILQKYNVGWLNNFEITKLKFIEKYGGIVQLTKNCDKVLNIYDSPYDVYSTHEGYKEKGFTDALRPYHKTHRAYGYTWYRLNELPEEYKPLLEEYYNTKPDSDNLEIGDDNEYIY